MKRSIGRLQMLVEVEGERGRRSARTYEWNGGERYGGENDVYYRPVRGVVEDVEPGDVVTVTFRGRASIRTKRPVRESEPFTYTVEGGSDAEVLVLAYEDYDGPNPEQEADAPKYADYYTDALEANGIDYDTWDVDARGAPHPLGVLSHYDAVVWYTGDDRIPQDDKDAAVLGQPDLGVSQDQQNTTIAVRDYLNEGGKLLYSGESAGYFGRFGVLFYGDDDDASAPCAPGPGESIFDACLLYSDDFQQYYLGAYSRVEIGAPTRVVGVDEPLTGGAFAVGGGDGADNQDRAGAFLPTSEVLPVEDFPLFRSWKSGEYDQGEDYTDPYAPVEGEWYAGVTHADSGYHRLTREIDLTGASAGELAFQLSYDTEGDYDYAIVEARTAGGDDWTTLPEADGQSTTETGSSCAEGLWEGLHPQLDHYLTFAGDSCTPTGTTGEWNGFNGNSGGWQDVSFDLSAYAGSVVEVSVAYVTDPGTGGNGVFVDDVRVTVDGVVGQEGFEDDLGAWTVPGAPADSPGNTTDWQRAQELVPPSDAAAVTTEDSVYFGYGFEAIATEAERTQVMGRVMDYLLG